MMYTKKCVGGVFLAILISLTGPSDLLAQNLESKKEAIAGLQEYTNQKLFCLDAENRARAVSLINRILPNDDRNRSSGIEWAPWYVFEMPTANGKSLLVLVETPTILVTPGQARARLNFFDSDGRQVAASDVSLGWRIRPKDVRLFLNTSLGHPLLEISSEGRQIDRQYFVLQGTSVSLVRLETAEGEIVRNRFDFPNYTIGRVELTRSANEWKVALESTDRAEVLKVLVWLGGIHEDVQDESSNKGPLDSQVPAESASDAKLVVAVRNRTDVRKLLERLMHSENKWIREAAELVLKPALRVD